MFINVKWWEWTV